MINSIFIINYKDLICILGLTDFLHNSSLIRLLLLDIQRDYYFFLHHCRDQLIFKNVNSGFVKIRYNKKVFVDSMDNSVDTFDGKEMVKWVLIGSLILAVFYFFPGI